MSDWFCTKCKQYKEWDAFYIDKRRGEPRYQCKTCTKKQANDYYHKMMKLSGVKRYARQTFNTKL